MSATNGYSAISAVAFLAVVAFSFCSSAQSSTDPNVIILLRLAGHSQAVAEIGSCLASKLSRMPDVEITTGPADGVRFIIDIIATKGSLASVVVAETFPVEQYRVRIKEGEDSDAVLAGIRFFTLLRLHELVPARSRQDLCTNIAAEISDKVLSKEYTERND
jgi:hypothetical protein